MKYNCYCLIKAFAASVCACGLLNGCTKDLPLNSRTASSTLRDAEAQLVDTKIALRLLDALFELVEQDSRSSAAIRLGVEKEGLELHELIAELQDFSSPIYVYIERKNSATRPTALTQWLYDSRSRSLVLAATTRPFREGPCIIIEFVESGGREKIVLLSGHLDGDDNEYIFRRVSGEEAFFYEGGMQVLH